jgi:hypothetical protein
MVSVPVLVPHINGTGNQGLGPVLVPHINGTGNQGLGPVLVPHINGTGNQGLGPVLQPKISKIRVLVVKITICFGLVWGNLNQNWRLTAG